MPQLKGDPEQPSQQLFARRRSTDRLVVGYARVVDGDTVVVAGSRIRLEGIDAPEMAQVCTRLGQSGPEQAPREIKVGPIARRALVDMIANRPLMCTWRKRDRYKRLLATCSVNSVNVNQAMVLAGAAWAFRKYSRAYGAEESVAESRRAGIWGMRCKTAAAFREARWREAQMQAPQSCPIKGNISSHGRIYHVPWSRHYGRTRITPRGGDAG
ncbi:MAG: thermonuclease family protein, partial [Pseudomonadota bacterium]